MAKDRFPPAWDEERIQRLLTHYGTQSDDAALAEDQASLPQFVKSTPSAAGMPRGEQMTREAGWGAIKAKLKDFRASELVTLVRDLYQASPENRQFLRGRL